MERDRRTWLIAGIRTIGRDMYNEIGYAPWDLYQELGYLP